MNENEAKTKLCVHQPSERACLTNEGTVARIYAEAKCVGSECMAWRWNLQAFFKDTAIGDRTGYCGLAGKP